MGCSYIKPIVDESLRCEFCGRPDGQLLKVLGLGGFQFVAVQKEHFEQCLPNPRKINICDSCHCRFHSLLYKHSKEDAEKLCREGY